MRKFRCRSAADAVPCAYGTSPSTRASSTSSTSEPPGDENMSCTISTSSEVRSSEHRHRADDVLGFQPGELGVVDPELLAQHLSGVLSERGRGSCPDAHGAARESHRPRRVMLFADERVVDELEEAAGAHLRIVER